MFITVLLGISTFARSVTLSNKRICVSEIRTQFYKKPYKIEIAESIYKVEFYPWNIYFFRKPGFLV